MITNDDLSEAYGGKKRASRFNGVKPIAPAPPPAWRAKNPSWQEMSPAEVAKALLGEDAPEAGRPKPPLGQEDLFTNKDGTKKTPDEQIDFAAKNQEKAVLTRDKATREEIQATADRAKAAAADPKKPLWSQREEARYRDAEKFGGVPARKIYSQPANVPGDPSKIPAGLEDHFRTSNSNERNPRTGLTDEGVWKSLFTPRGPQQDGVLPEPPDPTAQMPRPADNAFDKQFNGQWGGATPAQRAALLRSEIGPAGQDGWVTPADTAQTVGASTDVQGNRTVSGPYGSGVAVLGAPVMPAVVNAVPVPEAAMPIYPMPGMLPKEKDTL